MAEQATERVTSAFILAALRRHHSDAALVHEVTILDTDAQADEDRMTPEKWRPTTRRIDVLMFDQLIRTAIEIKVSVADAKRDTWQKVEPWRRVVHRFVYAVPAGLIEVPPVYGCGLWWVHADGRIEVRRRTKVNPTPEPLPQRVIQTLAYRACGQQTIHPEETTDAE